MSRTESDEPPDSRDPAPPRRALKRIAHEAHEIRQRQEARLRELVVRALHSRAPPVPREVLQKEAIERDEDLAALAVLVAELADVVKEREEQRSEGDPGR
jgi:hypothetical protein